MKCIKLYYLNIFAVIVFMSIALSCSLETYSMRKIYADDEILSYIKENNLDIVPDSTGIAFYLIQNGFGSVPMSGDKVAFHYTGTFFDGEIFDSSYDRSYPLIVELSENKLIKGLVIALLRMNKGSKAKVIVPFYLAYDNIENAPVPPYSNLVFEIELIDYTTLEK